MDLWPEIEEVKVKSPVTIVKEQASVLGRKTKNVLKAEVRPIDDKEFFYYRFFLVAPAIQNYHYELFGFFYGIPMYPVTFQVDSAIAEELKADNNRLLKAESEEEFIKILERILKSKKTVEVIQTLLTQSTDYRTNVQIG